MASFKNSKMIAILVAFQITVPFFALAIALGLKLYTSYLLALGILVLLVFVITGIGLRKKVYEDAAELGLSATAWSLMVAFIPIVGFIAYYLYRDKYEIRKKVEEERDSIDLNKYRDEIVAAELAEGETLSKRKVVKRPVIDVDEHGQIRE